MASEQKTKYSEMEKVFSMWKGNKGIPDKVEAGWFTNLEFAKQIKSSRSNSQSKLHKMIKEGLLEVRNFRIFSNNGNLKNVPHYKTKCTKK